MALVEDLFSTKQLVRGTCLNFKEALSLDFTLV